MFLDDRRPSRALASFALILSIAQPVLAAESAGAARPPWVRSGARLSAAGERLMREQIAAGRVLPAAALRRLGLDLPEYPEGGLEGLRIVPAAPERTTTQGLAPDRQVNDKTGDATCAGGCGNRPLSQSETSIAALGSFMVAGSNNSKGFCTGGAVQGYGTSVDGGVTWTWHAEVPPLAGGGRYRGDPVHAVNRKTGDFYILGIYDIGGLGPLSGLALLRGHFAGGAFVIDDNRQIAVGGSNFIDKPWMAVDSLSGNLYVSYSNFVGGTTSQIELIRSTDNGATWSAPLVIDPPAEHNNVQGSRPAVGPGGEVYVVWYEYGFPLSHLHIRRSTDLGVTFGTEYTIADYYENDLSGPPGFRRNFGINLPSIAVDNSPGLHRGRIYVAWDEAVDFKDAPAPGLGNLSEVENNRFFAAANPFTVGQVLRGSIASAADTDLFVFSGLQGQTLFFRTDSAATGLSFNLRLACVSDTSNLFNYRLLAFSSGQFPAVPFTLPAGGSYYLHLSGISGSGNYRILTSWDTPTGGERGRDQRDRFVSWSDNTSSWSTPVRLNDDDPWFDGNYPEVTVDGLGRAHVFWHDFRDDVACGALSYEYMTSSGDGGANWGTNRRVSDVQSFWSFNACGSANQGDYQGITSDVVNVYPCWADSRLGDPDVFMECMALKSMVVCPTPGPVNGDSVVTLPFTLTNSGNVDGTFSWQLEDSNGWLTGASPGLSGTVALAAGAPQVVTATLHPPASCAPALTDVVRFITFDLAIPGATDTCLSTLSCSPTVSVRPPHDALLTLSPPRPNPARRTVRLGFTLPSGGPARLAIYGAGGARVRTLLDGVIEPGPQEREWDGRDQRGRRVPPGVYFVRLEAGGRALRRVVTMLP